MGAALLFNPSISLRHVHNMYIPTPLSFFLRSTFNASQPFRRLLFPRDEFNI